MAKDDTRAREHIEGANLYARSCITTPFKRVVLDKNEPIGPEIVGRGPGVVTILAHTALGFMPPLYRLREVIVVVQLVMTSAFISVMVNHTPCDCSGYP